jgi:hypothetical protein
MQPLFQWLKLDERARSYGAMRAFAVAAGARLLKVARAERLQGRTLYVRVVSSAWSQDLSTRRIQLLEKLRRTIGGECVSDLRFSVGPLEELPDFGAAPVASPAAVVQADKPPFALDTELERAVAEVGDPELRSALLSALTRRPQE